MACSETWKEQEVQERFPPFRPAVPTLTSLVLEVVLPKLCYAVPLVPCAAVTALAASQAAERERLDSPFHHRLPERWVLPFLIGTHGCAHARVEDGRSALRP